MMKYIVYKCGNEDVERMSIFKSRGVHKEVFNKIKEIEENVSVISAGYLHLDYDEFICFGDSTTLEIEARSKEDTRLLNEQYSFDELVVLLSQRGQHEL